ncbi:Uncharacterized protein HZ326_11975 [Fusarium oxysporum f. sp. albedinis]|nr:Uncharacterized protein HZ326_11975 [Fusarium oxysporum f. sp. albedinis]
MRMEFLFACVTGTHLSYYTVCHDVSSLKNPSKSSLLPTKKRVRQPGIFSLNSIRRQNHDTTPLHYINLDIV